MQPAGAPLADADAPGPGVISLLVDGARADADAPGPEVIGLLVDGAGSDADAPGPGVMSLVADGARPDADAPGPGVMSLVADGARPDEAYRLTVDAGQVVAVAAGDAGLRWAVQALRQLMPPEIYGKEARPDLRWTIAAARIEDRPRYAWRGLMLDVGRWYKPVEWLYTVVDLIAMHRMNVLHLHLTDDQGWRFEVKRYPRLTTVGGHRRESPLGLDSAGAGDGVPHGGFYTQEQLRALVAYARERGVTIVPEIDVPGHTQAAIAAYPELGNVPDRPVEVWTRFGISERVLNAEERTVRFFTDVLDELLDVFPSPYIHLGGDEVPTREWTGSPRIAELGLREPGDLLGWWLDRLTTHVTARGRRAVIWDEGVRQAPDQAVVMAWRDEDRVAAARAAGHDVVAAPHTSTYLNYPAAAGPSEPLSIGSDGSHGPLPLAKVHAYDPGPVLGVQASLWTEYAASPARAEYDLMPRLAAMAEVGWGTRGDLATLLPEHLRRLDAAGIGYRPLIPE
jgi:hexosaminidase